MNTIHHSAEAHQTLRELETQVEALARACDRLRDENRMLRHQNEQLLTERSILTERGEQARIKVESMINRLKSMEQAV
ncbi:MULTISPECIES: TIGR02449 family protein [Ectothiorhodospira]|jgi:cell division protein ZapB|nr:MULTISPECIES: TIGR02449 family protein [Ectothiorhodospira]MCG5517242.1 TIGR02449 family protein [Ectothiorhodospira sp. 9100]MCG5520137.1 TIGR02449 family protein [Ectothiorhodospira sp. 9905]